MIRRTIIFISHFLFVCLNFYNANAQHGYTLLDSCFQEVESYTTYSRTLLVNTDSGSYVITQQMSDDDSIWTTNGVSRYTLYNVIYLYDSIGRLIESDRLIFNPPQWNYSRRSLFSYDSYGRVTDSLQQVYNGSSWVDTLQWSWQKDSAGNFIFHESKYFINGVWLNGKRKEWYYDSLSRDTLHLTYIGDSISWTPESSLASLFGNFGCVDSVYQIWNDTAWIKSNRIQRFYQALDEDTLVIFYNGLSNQWDTVSIYRKQFNNYGKIISMDKYSYVNMNWVYYEQSLWTYDSTSSLVSIVKYGNRDSLGWHSKDSTTISNNTYMTHIFHWNGSSLECSEFKYISYYTITPLSFASKEGFLDSDCQISGYMSDIIEYYDLAGRLTYHEFDGHAGDSQGSSSYLYDSTGFLYQQHSSSSTMGGITHEYHCVHYRPLLFLFENISSSFCRGDSIAIIAHPSGGTFHFKYEWKFNNQPLSDTLAVYNGISFDHSGWYTMTVTDTLGNYYSDSILVEIHPDVHLGNDTIVCNNSMLTLIPGNYSTYLWQDGSTTSSHSALSSVSDTILYWVQVSDSSGCTNRDSLTIVFDVCQLIPVTNKYEFNISPNPTTGHLIISLPEQSPYTEVTITNAFGQEVSRSRYSNTLKLELEIKGENGLYFVRVVAGEKRGGYKVVKMEN